MTTFRIKNDSIKKLGAAIEAKLGEKLTSPATRGKLSSKLRPFIQEWTSIAIGGKSLDGNTQVAKAFRPDLNGGERLIAELGIGDGNSPDEDKIKNGWRPLMPEGIDSAGKVTISFAKDSLAVTTYSLSTTNFYNAKVNNYLSFKDSVSTVVPWMQQYIEGVDVNDYDFSPKDPQKRSRTGLGLMVKSPGTLFRIPPLAFDPFDKIRIAIRARFARNDFIIALKKVILDSIV